jgi:hypothetical protein
MSTKEAIRRYAKHLTGPEMSILHAIINYREISSGNSEV